MSLLTRLLARLRKPVVDKLAAIQPRVTPDPFYAAALEQRRELMKYSPAHGFLADQQQPRRQRSNVVQFRGRRA